MTTVRASRRLKWGPLPQNEVTLIEKYAGMEITKVRTNYAGDMVTFSNEVC